VNPLGFAVDPVDELTPVPVEEPMTAGRLGPVVVVLNVLPAGELFVLVLAEEAVLWTADGCAGVAGVPLVAVLDREVVLLMLGWPAGVAEVPLVPVLAGDEVLLMLGWPVGAAEATLAPVLDKDAVFTVAVRPLGVVVLTLVPRAVLLSPEDMLVAAFFAVATEPLTSAALRPLVGPLAEPEADVFALLEWAFCKALARLCSLVLVLVPFAVECRG
jgi:hypothetical protein